MISIFRPLFKDLGIDLGTANTIIFQNKKGFIVNAPSVVAIGQNSRTVALGLESTTMNQAPCRRLRFTNTYNQLRGVSEFVFCRQPDGEWKVAQ